MVRSVSEMEAAAAPKTPAAVRTIPSISERGASGTSTLSASDSPVSRPIGAPSALANAATDATRRSGTISSPAMIVCSSSSETPGTTSDSLVGSA